MIGSGVQLPPSNNLYVGGSPDPNDTSVEFSVCV